MEQKKYSKLIKYLNKIEKKVDKVSKQLDRAIYLTQEESKLVWAIKEKRRKTQPKIEEDKYCEMLLKGE